MRFSFTGPSGTLRRWIAFNLVGATGIIVQLALLAGLLASGLGYLGATVVAVEAAVVNNFFWHEKWTWRDRTSGGPVDRLVRLSRFNLTVGAISIGENVFFMKLLVGALIIPPLFANVLSIAACSLANFLISDRLVFRRSVPADTTRGL